MIGMLSAHLEQGGLVVIDATGEGNAGIAIVRKAIELGEYVDVAVIADDADIFVVFMYVSYSWAI